jgi:hypothetical protein
MAGLQRDTPRPGRKPTIGARLRKRVGTLTTRQQPTNAAHRSTRAMAAAVGISEASVRAHLARPQREAASRGNMFEIRNHPEFAENVDDIVGLYLDPPEHALVLCAPTKTAEFKLGLGPRPACLCSTDDDYEQRHGHLICRTECGQRRVFGLCQKRHRHQDWLKFLRLIDETIPPDRQPHLICDNYATPEHPQVRRCLARHPRFYLYFTPSSAPSLNMVERFFRDLTQNRLRRGVLRRSGRTHHGHRHLHRPP